MPVIFIQVKETWTRNVVLQKININLYYLFFALLNKFWNLPQRILKQQLYTHTQAV
jgi:hypothetical protein